MIIYEGIGGLVLFLAMATLAIFMYGRMCRDAGYEEGRADQYTAIGELAEMAELADHAGAGCPVPTFTPAGQDQRPPWYQEVGASAAATAAALGLPGPDRIQPARDSGAGTVIFPRVQLTDASTGEIRGLGDAMVAAIEAAS